MNHKIENGEMGKVEVKMTVTNLSDLNLRDANVKKPEEVRKLEITGLVDTGATGLCLPIDYIEQLGLKQVGESRHKTANGEVTRRIFSEVLLDIMGRSSSFRVTESPNDVPPLIGFLILEAFDYVVDTKNQKLMGNPEHGGEWVLDLY